MLKRIMTLIAAGLALAGCAPSERPEAAYPPIGKFVEVKGLPIHYAEAGEGPTVILIHGANGNLRDFTYSLFGKLAERYHVIAFDRPGHGYSARPAVDGEAPAVQAAILSEAAAKLGVKRAVLVGHSWGGAVAAAWALDRPEQTAAMVSLAGAVYPWGGGGGALYAMANSGIGPLLGAAARTYVSGDRMESLVADVFAPNPPAPGYARYIGVPLALRPDTFRYNAVEIDHLNDMLKPQAARYGELAMPVEIVHGEEDKTVGYEVHSVPLQRAAQRANLTLIPGVGHMPHHAAEPVVIDVIDRAAERAGLSTG